MKLLPALCAAALLAPATVQSREARVTPERVPWPIELGDQFGALHTLSFPATHVTILALADRKSSDDVATWVLAFKTEFGERVAIRGLANLAGVPEFLRGKVLKKFRETCAYPVMLDWSGKWCERLSFEPGSVNILVIGREGKIRARILGPATPPSMKAASRAVRQALGPSSR